MDVFEAMKTRRTIRRYKPDPVPQDLLLELVDCARLAPSAANLQPLEYVVVADEKLAADMYPLVKMGSYLQGDESIGDDPSERPGAYIAVLIRDTRPTFAITTLTRKYRRVVEGFGDEFNGSVSGPMAVVLCL